MAVYGGRNACRFLRIDQAQVNCEEALMGASSHLAILMELDAARCATITAEDMGGVDGATFQLAVRVLGDLFPVDAGDGYALGCPEAVIAV